MISEIIRPETFYEPRNQKIYQAIQNLNMSERPVDIMTVTEELKKEATSEKPLEDGNADTHNALLERIRQKRKASETSEE